MIMIKNYLLISMSMIRKAQSEEGDDDGARKYKNNEEKKMEQTDSVRSTCMHAPLPHSIAFPGLIFGQLA